jgi:hypothetical protein
MRIGFVIVKIKNLTLIYIENLMEYSHHNLLTLFSVTRLDKLYHITYWNPIPCRANIFALNPIMSKLKITINKTSIKKKKKNLLETTMGCSYMQVLHGGDHHGGCGRCHHIYIYIWGVCIMGLACDSRGPITGV